MCSRNFHDLRSGKLCNGRRYRSWKCPRRTQRLVCSGWARPGTTGDEIYYLFICLRMLFLLGSECFWVGCFVGVFSYRFVFMALKTRVGGGWGTFWVRLQEASAETKRVNWEADQRARCRPCPDRTSRPSERCSEVYDRTIFPPPTI